VSIITEVVAAVIAGQRLRNREQGQNTMTMTGPQQLCNSCKRPTTGTRCPECAARHRTRTNRRDARLKANGDSAWAHKFYRTAAWQRCRRFVLADSPLCVDCKAEGFEVLAVDVHHDQPCSQSSDRNLDPSNLVPLCKRHHTRRENKERPGRSFRSSNAQATGSAIDCTNGGGV
jgi:5-methylcytosine-specific restriction protein A